MRKILFLIMILIVLFMFSSCFDLEEGVCRLYIENTGNTTYYVFLLKNNDSGLFLKELAPGEIMENDEVVLGNVVVATTVKNPSFFYPETEGEIRRNVIKRKDSILKWGYNVLNAGGYL